MTTISIDGVEYDVEGMTKEQRLLVNAIGYCDKRKTELDHELAAIQTARQAYVNDLGAQLKEE
jgi:hypothetical protein